jgi:hypothetical protein
MKDILPSMPKGEIVGNMATAKLTQMIKVVIDGNRLFMENRGRNTEAETQMLQHKCCNTNANANTDAETQCCNRVGTQKLTQMVKVVIDGNRLFMEHAQETLEMLEHKRWYTDAETQMRPQMLQHKRVHRCCNTKCEHRRCNTSANTDVG